MSARLFLRRLPPVDGQPRTLVIGVLTGGDAIAHGPDDQLVEASPSEASYFAEEIRLSRRRGEAEIDLSGDGRGEYVSTIGVSNSAIMSALSKARIKEPTR